MIHNINRMNIGFSIEEVFSLVYQKLEPGFMHSGESHPMPELVYVDRGELHSVVSGRDMLLKQGDIVLYGPNQWHMQYVKNSIASSAFLVTFSVSECDLSSLFDRHIHASKSCITLLRNMLSEQERADVYSKEVIKAQLQLLLLYLLRDNREVRPADDGLSVIRHENEIVQKAQRAISEHIREKLSVPVAAEYAGVSPSYLTVMFQKYLEISPGEYIRRVKLEESKRMIRETEMNFTEIASALQYSTVHHYSRQFKDTFGITPTEYAKSVRKDKQNGE